jgi:hypothetical protein
MKVISINFNTEHKVMLGHAKMLLEDGFIAIDPCFDKLHRIRSPSTHIYSFQWEHRQVHSEECL